MKHLFIITCISLLSVNAFSQQLKPAAVPFDVKKSFTKMYPGIKDPAWEKEDGMFEAEFKQNGKEIAVLFDEAGTYVQTETEIKVSDLPDAVNQYVKKNLSKKKIAEAAKITDSKGTLTYEAEIGGEDYLFASSGIFIKKIVENTGTEDKD